MDEWIIEKCLFQTKKAKYFSMALLKFILTTIIVNENNGNRKTTNSGGGLTIRSL
jgi:hypothetical protein